MSFVESASAALGTAVKSCSPSGGGSVNRGWKIETDDGRILFGKSRPAGSTLEFSDEAAGLQWLSDATSLAVPEVIAVIDDDSEPGLLLEWIEPGPDGDQADLGRGLALLHQTGVDSFDQTAPDSNGDELRFGEASIPLDPAQSDEGFAVIYARRLRALTQQAFDEGSLGSSDRDVIEQVADRAAEIVGPSEPPARIHGDFWSGNIIWNSGRPFLIDPAAHGAHRELDLAMLEMFSSPDPSFYSAYEEVSPLAEGFRERIGFWQLQPLLVHAVIMGRGYARAAAVTARNYL